MRCNNPVVVVVCIIQPLIMFTFFQHTRKVKPAIVHQHALCCLGNNRKNCEQNARNERGAQWNKKTISMPKNLFLFLLSGGFYIFSAKCVHASRTHWTIENNERDQGFYIQFSKRFHGRNNSYNIFKGNTSWCRAFVECRHIAPRHARGVGVDTLCEILRREIRFNFVPSVLRLCSVPISCTTSTR